MPLHLIRQDLTTMDCDAIVNPSNVQLEPGGGLDAAIHKAAGPSLRKACRDAAPCPMGQSRVTPAFRLKCQWVIHTAAPVWRGGLFGEKKLLAACYQSCVQAAKELGPEFPLLGVCLGHQAICAAFGAVVTYAKALMHGKQSVVRREGNCPLFADCPETFPVARYHSLAAAPETMPECLEVTARTEDGEVMAVQHKEYPVYGVQFHPESILTPEGHKMLENFMALRNEK